MPSVSDKRRWACYSDFYKTSQYAIFPQEHRQLPGALEFRMIRAELGAHDFSDPAVPEVVLGLTLTASRNCSWVWNMGDGWHREKASVGRLIFLPADTDSRWEVSGERRVMMLTIPSTTMRRVVGSIDPRLSSALGCLSEASWEDPFLQTVLLRLWESSVGQAPMDRLFADGALITILSQLHYRAGLARPSSDSPALSSLRLDRIRDYVEAHMSEQFGLTDLARESGLSVRHLCRAFRREVGLSPHRWVMGRRVERARQLLLHSQLSLTEIAEGCGFADQSHLTRAIRRATGLSPLRYRRDHRRG